MRYRRLVSRFLVTLSLFFGLAPCTHAAPVIVDASLNIVYPFESPYASWSTRGTVDVSGGTLTIPAGLIAFEEMIVPVSGSTAVNGIVLRNFYNQAGSFRLGGVATQAPSEVCPGTGNHPSGFACNVGFGFGGTMLLSGDLVATAFPGLSFVYRFEHLGVGRGGSSDTSAFSGAILVGGDGAAWSTRGLVGAASRIYPFTGSYGAQSLSLVSPVFISFLGDWLDVRLGIHPVTFVPEAGGLLLILGGVIGGLLLMQR